MLVGGRHPCTGEPTDQFLTSSTGQQWESSLPPMPTKRYQTSAVSVGSPEVLVVAGGRGSHYEELNVVEVLRRDKWVTVDPLPMQASSMSSTLHDGKIHFMKHGRQSSTVFTCSYTSLMSSSVKSSGAISSPIWTLFQAPGGWGTTITSHLSRLVIIDEWERVRGYSRTTQSWLKSTSTGPTLDGDGITAATVLKTGEIVIAHQLGGVYRGTLSGEREKVDGLCYACETMNFLQLFS